MALAGVPLNVSVLAQLLESQRGRSYAGELAEALGKSHTAVGTTLNRLEASGYVIGAMEPIEAAQGRAPRRYFTITPEGSEYLRQFAANWQAQAKSLLTLVTTHT